MVEHAIRIDRTAPQGREPAGGHSREPADGEPIDTCQPDDEVEMEPRDALGKTSTAIRASRAHTTCSVAVDLKNGELVDVSNFIVSAVLSLALVGN